MQHDHTHLSMGDVLSHLREQHDSADLDARISAVTDAQLGAWDVDPQYYTPEEMRAAYVHDRLHSNRDRWLKRTAVTIYDTQNWIRSDECTLSPLGKFCLWANYAELREVTRD